MFRRKKKYITPYPSSHNDCDGCKLVGVTILISYFERTRRNCFGFLQLFIFVDRQKESRRLSNINSPTVSQNKNRIEKKNLLFLTLNLFQDIKRRISKDE